MSIKSPLSRQFGSRFDSVFDVVKSNPVYDKVSRIPTLDLDFAKTKSLYDGRSTKNLIDFVRDTASNSSTYVGADRLIKRSVTNLMLQSEDFSTSWILSNATIDTNVIAAPNGTTTADKLVENSSTGNKEVNQGNVTFTSGTSLTISCFVKAAGRTRFRFAGTSARFGSGTNAYFDLSTGTVVSTTGGMTSASITPYPNGWYRCTATMLPTSSGTDNVFITLINTGTTSNYTGDGSSGIYLWGAQLEEASTVGEYVKTTTTKSGAPRFDHDPATGESLGLLVEESRTNLLLYSTNFDNNYWLQTNITTNSITAPDGTLTAATYEGTGAGQSVYNPTSATVTASTNYTYSIYVKLGTMSAGNYKFAVYDASNSSFVGVDLVPSVTPTTTSWTRVTYSFTTPSGCTELRVYPFRSSSSITSSTVHFWGAQVEAGAFATSYIPTEGATVTRGVDVASISGTNFSSWYEQSEGTVFADSARYALGNSAGQYIVCEAGNSSFNNDDLIQLGSQYGSNNFQFLVNVGNVNEVALVEAGVVTQSKYVGAYKINDFAYTKNGASPATDTSGTTPTVSKFNIGSRPAFGNTGYLNGTIKHLTYWDARVANEKLQSVTS